MMSQDEWVDQFYDAAVAFVRRTKKCKAVDLQKEFRIGYPTAARLQDRMEEEGVISERGNDGQREVFPVKRCPVCKADRYSEDDLCLNCYLGGHKEWPEEESDELLQALEQVLLGMFDSLRIARENKENALAGTPMSDMEDNCYSGRYWIESQHIWLDRIYYMMGSYRACLVKCRPQLVEQVEVVK